MVDVYIKGKDNPIHLLTDNDVLFTRNFFTNSHKDWTKIPPTDESSNSTAFSYNNFFRERKTGDYVVSALVDNSHGNTTLRLQCWTPKQFYFSDWLEPKKIGLLTLKLPADLFDKKENYYNGNIVINTYLKQGDTNAFIKHEMLELGSTPSNWVPAPEDLGLVTVEQFNELKSRRGGG